MCGSDGLIRGKGDAFFHQETVNLLTVVPQAVAGFIKDIPNQVNRLGVTLAQGAQVQAAQYAEYGAYIQGDREADTAGNALRMDAFKDLATPTADLYELSPIEKIGSQAIGLGLAADSLPTLATLAITKGPLVGARFGEVSGDLRGVFSARNTVAPLEDLGGGTDALGSANLIADSADVVPNSSLVDSEASALQRIGANNTSTDGAIFNARISLKPYVVNGDVNGLIDQLDVSTGGAQTGFWSGNLSAAMEQASGKGVSLLETTPGGQIANNWGFLNKTWGWSNGGETFWSGLSSKFASGAEGDVFVYQTPDKAMSAGQLNWQGGYVWGNYEKPILLQLQNQGVVGNINYQLVEPPIQNAPMRWH